MIPDLPIGQGSRPGLISADVTKVPSIDNIILARQPITSTTSFYEIVGGKLVDVGPEISEGVQMATVDGKQQLVQTRFESMGGSALLEYGPLGSWKFLQCSRQSIPGDIFGPLAPIHCAPTSSGGSHAPFCATKTSQATCVGTSSCGWCAQTNQCMPGHASGACNSADLECPASDWAFTGGQEKSSVQETNEAPVFDCSGATDCRSCVADSRCGFVPSLKQCVLGSPRGPSDRVKYNVALSDWDYYYCTGAEGCSNLVGCNECSTVSFCGYCAATSSCLVGNLNGPMFGQCAGGYTFDAQTCPL